MSHPQSSLSAVHFFVANAVLGLIFGLWLGILHWARMPWPGGGAQSLRDYLLQLLGLLILMTALYVTWQSSRRWRPTLNSVFGAIPNHSLRRFVLMGSVAGLLLVWLAVAGNVYSGRHQLGQAVLGLPWYGALCLIPIKAGVAAGIEELAFRGVLLPVSAAYLGALWGNVYQAVIGTAMHMPLASGGIGQSYFLVLVLALGLILGAISGWQRTFIAAWLIHWGIGIIVEWRNIY
ncbi:MAG: CPBP family intramembrane metalloprotease [Candidatus Hydrogenedentes bacterium]|nr:CPBP family intramembrane metalloprotease [Candidatus Hydrogenedentota bacterium]